VSSTASPSCRFARPHEVRHEVDGLGDVLCEDDAPLGRRADEAGDPTARALEHLGGLARERVDAAVHVGVVALVVAAHRVDHRRRALRGGGGVEVDDALAGDLPVEDREVLADGGDVEAHRQAS
jgi:hypothetical protein